ncbi:MAG: WS/DGAT domain-containing protein [Candidatus Binatia bacterium]|nr:WS/DGAT domain-containing protein [Candidatus Binatia bacterium]
MLVYSDMNLADHHPPALNLVASNVLGPPFALYANGATAEAMYPMGPIMDGGALNLTVITYRNLIDFGALGYTELVPEIDQIAHGFGTAVQTLLDRANLEQPADVPQ